MMGTTKGVIVLLLCIWMSNAVYNLTETITIAGRPVPQTTAVPVSGTTWTIKGE